jgi:hypothetical protein
VCVCVVAAGAKKEGTGGREVKTKSTKKKGRGRDAEDDSEEEGGATPGTSRQQELSFMEISDIQEHLHDQEELRDCPDALLKDIATQLYRYLCVSVCMCVCV